MTRASVLMKDAKSKPRAYPLEYRVDPLRFRRERLEENRRSPDKR